MFWDNYSVIKTAVHKGVKQEKIDTIHRLNEMGLNLEQIAQGSDMNVEEVKKFLK
jgi:predicted transposase YdaD